MQQTSATASAADLVQALARFAASVTPEEVPQRVAWQAKLCLLDTIGCIISGSGEAESLRLLAAERLCDPGGGARVAGQAGRMSPEAAARVNAYMGDLFELNDLIGGHASIASVSAALAVADEQPVDGRRFLSACIAGIESTTRVHFAYYARMKPYTDMAVIPPAMPNAIGAAAAAAIVSGAGEERIAQAMAIALSLASWAPAEIIFGDGGLVKPMLHGSMPAGVGITAARYALGGMTGPHALLEGEGGLYATIGRGFDPAAIAAPTGWHLVAPRRKLHAACGYIHSAIDLMGRLYREQGAQMLARARAIRIHVPPYIMPAVVKSAPPTDPNNARFHIGYCAALAGGGVDVVLPEHSLAFDRHFTPEVADLMRRVAVEADETFAHYAECRIEVETAGGALVVVEGKAPRGAPENPLDEAGIKAKFASLVGDRMTAAACDRYAARIMAMESEEAVDWLLDPFCPG